MRGSVKWWEEKTLELDEIGYSAGMAWFVWDLVLPSVKMEWVTPWLGTHGRLAH